MSVTAPTTAAPVSAQKTNYVKKPSQEEKDQTLKEIEANMEKIRPRLVSILTSHHTSTAFNELDYPAFIPIMFYATEQELNRISTDIVKCEKITTQMKRSA